MMAVSYDPKPAAEIIGAAIMVAAQTVAVGSFVMAEGPGEFAVRIERAFRDHILMMRRALAAADEKEFNDGIS